MYSQWPQADMIKKTFTFLSPSAINRSAQISYLYCFSTFSDYILVY